MNLLRKRQIARKLRHLLPTIVIFDVLILSFVMWQIRNVLQFDIQKLYTTVIYLASFTYHSAPCYVTVSFVIIIITAMLIYASRKY